MFLITKLIPEPDEETLEKYADLAMQTCLREGITSFIDAGADSNMIKLYQTYLAQNK
ncbi:MAG: hypothetical protein R3B47_14755 [Bacteroidia bacterium]